jgi:hypothetical protein
VSAAAADAGVRLPSSSDRDALIERRRSCADAREQRSLQRMQPLFAACGCCVQRVSFGGLDRGAAWSASQSKRIDRTDGRTGSAGASDEQWPRFQCAVSGVPWMEAQRCSRRQVSRSSTIEQTSNGAAGGEGSPAGLWLIGCSALQGERRVTAAAAADISRIGN